MNPFVNVLHMFFNVVSVHVDCSARHQIDHSHEPCCSNHRTCLGLIRECFTCYLPLYDVTAAAFEWDASLEVVHVLFLLCVSS